MNNLNPYPNWAINPEKRARLEAQWKQAVQFNTITCECTALRPLVLAFRCLYCGQWYCERCAEIHFGKTIDAWLREQPHLAISPPPVPGNCLIRG